MVKVMVTIINLISSKSRRDTLKLCQEDRKTGKKACEKSFDNERNNGNDIFEVRKSFRHGLAWSNLPQNGSRRLSSSSRLRDQCKILERIAGYYRNVPEITEPTKVSNKDSYHMHIFANVSLKNPKEVTRSCFIKSTEGCLMENNNMALVTSVIILVFSKHSLYFNI